MPQRIALIVIGLILICTSLGEAAEKRFIIGFRKVARLAGQDKQNRVHRAGGRVRHVHTLINAVTAQLSEETARDLRLDPQVAYVEEDLAFSVEPPVVTSPEYVQAWGVQHIGADLAAQNGVKGAGIKVAILDSGIDYNHPDLKDNYRGGYNFVSDNNDPLDDSLSGHGTHVAGIIAAKGNGDGVVGVAPEASVYAVKVLDYSLFGSLSLFIAGIEWSIMNKMDVINMSFGAPGEPMFFSQALKDACDAASQAGIVLVAAAGNTAKPKVFYPAAFDSVIAVAATGEVASGATGHDDSHSSFSNYGDKVEVAAPGVNVKSTVPGGYAALSGTSQAAPHVAGVAALLLSSGLRDADGDGKRVNEVRARLAATARDLGETGRDPYFGYGLVQAPRYFTVTKTDAPSRDDALSVAVKPGFHVIEVYNSGLRDLMIQTPQGTENLPLMAQRICGKSAPDPAPASEAISFRYQADQETTLVFYPRGQAGGSANISISGN